MRLLFPARGFPTANGRGASFLVTMLEVSSKSSVLLLCLAACVYCGQGHQHANLAQTTACVFVCE